VVKGSSCNGLLIAMVEPHPGVWSGPEDATAAR